MNPRADQTLPVVAAERILAPHAILAAAHRSGILAAVAGEEATAADEIADAGGLDARATEVVLDALVELEVIARDGADYHAHPELPALVGTLEPILDTLTERLRTGAPALAGDVPAEAGPLYEDLSHLLGRIFREVADEAAALLAAPGLRILDAGAGAAPWSRAIVQREPSCHVDALDLPRVVPTTRVAVAEAGLAERFRFIEGDILRDEPPAGDYDLVLAANLCHLFDVDTAQQLVARLVAAARSDGTVAIIDAVPEHRSPHRRRHVNLYAASLLTRTVSGRVHTFEDYRRWLRTAGATRIRRSGCTRLPITVITAHVSDRPPADGPSPAG